MLAGVCVQVDSNDLTYCIIAIHLLTCYSVSAATLFLDYTLRSQQVSPANVNICPEPGRIIEKDELHLG